MITIRQAIQSQADPQRGKFFQRFFKTGPGQYAEGDLFLGLTVPQQRIIAKKFQDLSLSEIQKLLSSKYHEERLIALFILVDQYQRGDQKIKKQLYNFYLKNLKNINNWDLVDSSADKIVGAYLFDKSQDVLYKLAGSKKMWERRVAIISTLYFIRKNEFDPTLKISKMLLSDPHDLIHKAVGWMLREMGKRDEKALINFLQKYSHQMPRTALRYSIERFTVKQKKFFMQKKNRNQR